MPSDYHTVDYARHTTDNSVHLLDLKVGKTLCGRSGVFETLPASDALEDGMCGDCESAERPVYTDDGHVIAPQHGMDLAELDPYIIEGVAYSPLKMTFLSSSYDESLELRCNSCEWTTTVGDLPQDSGYVQPDMCPDCAKEGDLGFVRCESPADGTFPSGWNNNSDSSADAGDHK